MSNLWADIKLDLCKFTGCDDFRAKLILATFNPRFWPVSLHRIANSLYRHRLGVVGKLFSLVNQILFGCDIARAAQIGGGLYLPHPCGIVIGQFVRIGGDCIIHQGVTLGTRGEDHELSNPVVGDFVEIGTGAKILGNVRIGNYARIGANAVVLEDISAGGVVVGIPARQIKSREDISYENAAETR